jgi:ABC-type Na+ efflux pump permease subunit
MHAHAALTIARYTLLEALRNRLLWLVLLMALGAVGVSGFLNELALTESRELQAALLGAVLRLAAVFLVATFVVTSMVREANDQGLQLLMALPMPRAVYLFGKLAGFGALALLPALLFGALGLFFAPPAQAALWTISLLCECWIVAAFAVRCTLTLNQVTPALAAPPPCKAPASTRSTPASMAWRCCCRTSTSSRAATGWCTTMAAARSWPPSPRRPRSTSRC